MQWQQKIKINGGQTKKWTNFHTVFLANQKGNVIFLWQAFYEWGLLPSIFCGGPVPPVPPSLFLHPWIRLYRVSYDSIEVLSSLKVY